MIKEIKYNGYSAIPSDYNSNDGDLAASINLINENGNITPILQPKEVMDMPDDGKNRLVFIHKNTTFKHYIFYNEENNFLYWRDLETEKLTEIDYFYGLTHCNAIGNTLLVFTESAINYLLWSEDSYTILGDKLPTIDVSFGLYGHPRLYSKSNKRNSGFTVYFAEGLSASSLHDELSEANKTRVTEQIMAKLNSFISEQTVNSGRFCFPFLVRYALRLYDGSLVCHSAPILMNPSTTPAPLVMWGRIPGSSNYTQADDCDIMLVAADLNYHIGTKGYTILEKWQDIIKSIDVFITKPIYTYDQNGLITSLSDTDNFQSRFIGALPNTGYLFGGPGDYLQAYVRVEPCNDGEYPFYSLEGFDTKHINHMEWTYSRIYSMYFGKNLPGETFHLPEFENSKNKEQIKDASTFYKLYAITLNDIQNFKEYRLPIPISNDYLPSLVTREVMTDDYLTHDRLIAESSHVYNSRLNLSGIKRALFEGFTPRSMFAYCDRSFYFTEENGFIKIETAEVSDDINIAVYIKEGGKTHIVNASSSEMAPWMSREVRNVENNELIREKRSWGAYLFYPNVNAFRMVITSMFGATGSGMYARGQYAIELSPHEFLNGAYALLSYNLERTTNFSTEQEDIKPSPSPGLINPVIETPSKLYTSEVNNPFFFPVTGINTIGTGKILGISTAAKALSQGQFGQFPLYAFTDEGVWALEVSSTGTYTAKQPITRDVCINADGITQIDSAVLFPTDRGIMLISGSNTTCISEPINSDAPFDILANLPHMSELHDSLGHSVDSCLPVQPFTNFISDCRMIYDYPHQRIIVYNPGYTYAYVYSLQTKLWGMMYSHIMDNVNSYPEALAVTKDGKLIDFSKTGENLVSGLLVTRPLKLDNPDVLKTVYTIIQRGNFHKGNVQSVLYGSRDLYNWSLVWTSKDHYLRGFRGTPYKYYRIALLCNLADGESLYGASVQYELRKTNQLR